MNDSLNAPSEPIIDKIEFDSWNAGFVRGKIKGLEMALHAIHNAREFYRGTTYSTDSLVGMMDRIINDWMLDSSDPKRQLCEKKDAE